MTENLQPSGDTWNDSRMYVIKTLNRQDKDLDEFKKLQSDIISDLSDVKAQIAGLKVQSGIWGLIAGSLPVIIAMMIKLFFGG